MSRGIGDIAIIGWGSLIWDLDDLAPRVSGDWLIGAGPALPLEFTRVSAKRLGALTVVIDAEHGTPCPTHVIRSRRASLMRAVVDLALRERASPRRIGFVAASARAEDRAAAEAQAEGLAGIGAAQAAAPEVAARVRAWCVAGGWQGAVWTDLPGNFADHTGDPFALERAEAYLAALEGPARHAALRYITEAPAGTDTPLRRHLAGREWWRSAVGELGLGG